MTECDGRRQLGAEGSKRRTGRLTRRLMIVDRAVLVLLHHPPNRHAHASQETGRNVRVRIDEQPTEPPPRTRSLHHRHRIDVDIASTHVASQPDGENETDESDALVGRGEDPGLKDATRGGETG